MLNYMQYWFAAFLFSGVMVNLEEIIWPLRILTYTAPYRWAIPAIQVIEFRGLAGLFVEPRKIIHAQCLEGTNGSIVIDVVKHPAKIEDDRFR